MTPTAAKKINIQKLIAEILADLSARQRDVLVKRFGLKNGKRKTLEEIGEGYGITRERVRQIENDAKTAALRSGKAKQLEPVFQALEAHLESQGGVRTEHALYSKDIRNFFPAAADAGIAAAHLHFLLSLSPKFERHSETDDFHTAWAVKSAKIERTKELLNELTKEFESKKELLKKDALFEKAAALSGASDPKVLESYLAVAKNISANVYGEYGLAHWPEIKTRGVRDKAYLVLKKAGCPMHFREIVEEINKTFKLDKPAHLQTVHNELIKDDKFVLVGRGTYALVEWGYQPGRVSDVLARILKAAGRPMTREEIAQAVYKERNVKPNTIFLNLQNKKIFEKMDDGRFVYKS